jgi:hypothetical protein
MVKDQCRLILFQPVNQSGESVSRLLVLFDKLRPSVSDHG